MDDYLKQKELNIFVLLILKIKYETKKENKFPI